MQFSPAATILGGIAAVPAHAQQQQQQNHGWVAIAGRMSGATAANACCHRLS